MVNMTSVARNLYIHQNGVYYYVKTVMGVSTWNSLYTKNLREAKRRVREISKTGSFVGKPIRKGRSSPECQEREAAPIMQNVVPPPADRRPNFVVFCDDYLNGIANGGLAAAAIKMYRRCLKRLQEVLDKNRQDGESSWTIWERMENRGVWGYCNFELGLGASDLNQMRTFLSQIAKEAVEKTYLPGSCVAKSIKLQVVRPRQPQIPSVDYEGAFRPYPSSQRHC